MVWSYLRCYCEGREKERLEDNDAVGGCKRQLTGLESLLGSVAGAVRSLPFQGNGSILRAEMLIFN